MAPEEPNIFKKINPVRTRLRRSRTKPKTQSNFFIKISYTSRIAIQAVFGDWGNPCNCAVFVA